MVLPFFSARLPSHHGHKTVEIICTTICFLVTIFVNKKKKKNTLLLLMKHVHWILWVYRCVRISVLLKLLSLFFTKSCHCKSSWKRLIFLREKENCVVAMMLTIHLKVTYILIYALVFFLRPKQVNIFFRPRSGNFCNENGKTSLLSI